MMPTTIGNDFEYFDITTGENTVRHLIKDSEAREDISDLQNAIGTVPSGETVESQITDLKSALNKQDLFHEEIPNTIQMYTFSNGGVSQVIHSRNNETIRTDTFTYGSSTITEVRTLNTGETLSIVTNLSTLETTVTYAAA